MVHNCKKCCCVHQVVNMLTRVYNEIFAINFYKISATPSKCRRSWRAEDRTSYFNVFSLLLTCDSSALNIVVGIERKMKVIQMRVIWNENIFASRTTSRYKINLNCRTLTGIDTSVCFNPTLQLRFSNSFVCH